MTTASRTASSSKLLELNGYRVTVQATGSRRWLPRRDRPDAIVSDVLMPKMDGFALCHTWMQDADLEAIPFIFYSANLTLAEDAHVGKVLGAARSLIKPMQQEGFLRSCALCCSSGTGTRARGPDRPAFFGPILSGILACLPGINGSKLLRQITTLMRSANGRWGRRAKARQSTASDRNLKADDQAFGKQTLDVSPSGVRSE